MRKIILFFFLLFTANILFAQPIISSFSPATGPAGTPVIITGSNFSAVAANNVVYFGAVRATVTAASSNSLTVSAPVGATYKPVSVTTGGLTGYATKPFSISYTGSGGVINTYSFDTSAVFHTELHPNSIAFADIDGDGKADIITPNNYSINGDPTASFSVLRNTSTGGNIDFAPKVDIDNGITTYTIAAGDVDGDGKQDIIVSSIADQNISIFRNISTPGNILFAPKVSYATGSNPYCIVITDLNLDGKPDIAVANYLSSTVTLYKNTGSTGAISFTSAGTLTTGTGANSVAAADLDGDGKPDLAVANHFVNTISLFRNTGTAGNISFAAPTTYNSGANVTSVALGDIDGDGKTDMAMAGGSVASVTRNTGSTGAISFGGRVDYATSNASYVTIGDLNGDAKQDVLVTGDQRVVMRNQSTAGAITLAAPQYLSSTPLTTFVTEIADLNGDGKADLANALFTVDYVVVNRNKTDEPTISSFSPTSGPAGTSVTISGFNFTGATAVSFGGVPAASFTIVNNTTINAVVATGGASGRVLVTNPYGTTTLGDFTFIAPPTITSFTPTSGVTGTTVTITGTNMQSLSGVTFGSVVASSYTVVNSTTATAVVANGASGVVQLYSPFGSPFLAGFTYIPPPPVVTSFSPQTGITGTGVVITGTNFTGATAVTFGGVPAQSFTILSSTSILAVVGAGATGNVAVTTTGGTSGLGTFTYLPPPVITSFTPTSGAPGAIITITGMNFTGATAVLFGGTSATSFTVVSNTTITAVISNGASGAVSVISPNGTGTLAGFTYLPPPQIATFTPYYAPMGATITITGSNFTNASSVTFGGVPAASFVVNSPTLITAILGTGATGDLTVTTPYGSATVGSFIYKTPPTITSFTPTSSGNGLTVTINGTGFEQAGFGGTTASFGGVPALSTTWISQIKIQAVVGTGASGNVSVTTDFGTATAPGFTWVSLPVINSFSPAAASGGMTVTITGNNFNNATGVSFGGAQVTSFTVLSNTTIIAVLGTGSSGNVAVTTPGGTGSTGGFTFINTPVPVISSFSPASGPTGATVTITGTGFNPTAALNKVFFGAVQASIISAGSNSLTVSVPVAATLSPITVTSNGLITFSRVPFVHTYTGGAIAASTFSQRTDLPANGYALQLINADLDGDGKTDIIAGAGSGVTIYRNTGSSGTISFAPQQSFISTIFTRDVQAVDMNGDGKLDLLLTSCCNSPNGTDSLVILRNTSTPGNLSFIKSGVFITGDAFKLMARDIDGDGKPDLLGTDYLHNKLCIYRNTTAGNTISFAARQDYVTGTGPEVVVVTDLDGDGIPEVIAGALSVNFGTNNLNIFKNNSTPGNISLGVRTDIEGGNAVREIYLADIDGDNKTDLITIGTASGSNQSGTWILRNTSSSGTYSFAPKYAVPASYQLLWCGAVEDVDGDSKPDILVSSNYTDSISILRNLSVPGTVSLGTAVRYLAGFANRSLSIGDVDGDNKPDLIFSSEQPSSNVQVSVFRNLSGYTEVQICANTDYDLVSSVSGTSYQWQQNTGSGFVDLSNSSSFTGTNTNTLHFVNPQGSLTGSLYRCVVNSSTFSNTILITVNTGAVANAGPDVAICAGNSIQLTGTGGTTYSWSPATGLSNATIANPIASPAATTTYTLTASNGTCTSADNIIVTVNNALPASVSVTGSGNNICAGTSVTFTAVPLNGGIAPVYQWQVNGVNAGTNSNTFTTTTLTNNDQVKVIMTSNAACAVPAAATSNIITMNVTAIVTPSVTIATPALNVCPAATTTFTATPVNGGSNPSYQWQVNGVNAGTNSNTFTTTTLTNNDQVKVIMTSNAVCSSVATATSNTLTMSVGTVTPAVTITSTGSTICAGSTTIFTATPVNGGTAPSYQWQVNGVNAGTNSSTFTTTTLNNNDQVKVIMTGNALCSVPATATSNIITITVSASVAPSVSIAASATTICQGQSVSFTATAVNGGAAPAYQWQVNGVNSGTNNAVFITATLNNNDIVKVVMTSSAGCAVPASATSNSITMTVGSTQTPAVSVSTAFLNICAATPVTFTATPVNGGTTPAYQWQVNGINAGTNSSTFTAASLNNNDQVKVIMTSSATCAAQPTATSNVITVTVVSVTPSVSISTASTTVCTANNLTFTAAPVNGGSVPSYQWQVNGVNAGTNSNTFTTSALINGDVVKVIMTSNAACTTQPSATSNSITMSIGTVITPSVSLSIPSANICSGSNAVFTATVTNGGPSPVYQWKKNGNNIVNNGPVYTTANIAAGDVISVQVTGSGTCASANPVSSNSITVTVSAATIITISGNTTILAGSTSFITASVQNALSYQWQDSTASHSWQNIANATIYAINYTPAASGVKLRCKYFAGTACGEALTNVLTFVTESGFGDPNLPNNGIVYYPNPATSYVNIERLAFYDQWSDLEIRNTEGKRVFSNNNIWGNSKLKIDVRSLPAGLYIVTINRKKGKPVYLKFIKL